MPLNVFLCSSSSESQRKLLPLLWMTTLESQKKEKKKKNQTHKSFENKPRFQPMQTSACGIFLARKYVPLCKALRGK